MFTVEEKSILETKIPEMLNANEYQSLIAKIDDIGPEVALINTSHGTHARNDVRNKEQVMFDDVELADKGFRKAELQVPAERRFRRLFGADGRFRRYRYQPGIRFAPHADGSFERENDKSFYTFLMNLNEEFTRGHQYGYSA